SEPAAVWCPVDHELRECFARVEEVKVLRAAQGADIHPKVAQLFREGAAMRGRRYDDDRLVSLYAFGEKLADDRSEIRLAVVELNRMVMRVVLADRVRDAVAIEIERSSKDVR